jgi:7 transmembrane receptor (rhodopsin family)
MSDNIFDIMPSAIYDDVTVGHLTLSASASTATSPRFKSIDKLPPLEESEVNSTAYMEYNVTQYEDYYYDYDSAVNNMPLAEMVPVALVYGLTFVVGAVGNSLVIASIGRFRRLQSVTNIFLLSLASADLLLVCACVPIKVGKICLMYNSGCCFGVV